ncbi:MAG TPA: di-heme oxidoredictase family protein, partial [Thermoanaerobaculia bacterium]|nr:di-heme oxidoredictase family protein [Thermoanaerobaculia bacterium]
MKPRRLLTELATAGLAVALLAAIGLAGHAGRAGAQISVRPADPTGLSLKERRVRVIHSTDASLPGTSMYLQQVDPWLAYQRGRSYFFHEWSEEDGVFLALSSRAVAAATTSCGMCHNLPFRAPGAGGNTIQPVGYGLNTPHLFGVGLIELIGEQIRAEILDRFDRNHNGFLDVPAETRGRRLVIEAAEGVRVDFGRLDDQDGDGRPDLNGVIKAILVDRQGRARRWREKGVPTRLGDPEIAGYDPSVAILASSAGDHQFPSLRVFSTGVLRTVMGMVADDATSFQQLGKRPAEERERVWARVSNAGAPQPNLDLADDASSSLEKFQAARPGTISEGELDLLEWFLLNHPAPARGPQNAETHRGEKLLASLGCTACHVPDWQLKAADPRRGLAGDRRFFDLQVAANPRTGRLEGRLRDLSRVAAGPGGATLRVPRREGFRVVGIYSDFLHHDLGERFHELHYWGGTSHPLNRFRTPPLWGVGSTAPYGHDGRSLTLDDVIRRHGGEAEASQKAYLVAPEEDRRALLRFLESLVLYQPDTLPADLDGDGAIAPEFRLAGHPAGPERFNPELLFGHPPIYRGWHLGTTGERFFS